MPNASGLERLATVYEMVERIRSVELRIATSAVTEIEQAKSDGERVLRSVMLSGRAALFVGDQTEWMLARVEKRSIENRMRLLSDLKKKREVTRERALQAQQACRLRVEQVERVVESMRLEQSSRAERRIQAASDDRYGSRLKWLQRKTQEEKA